MIEITTEQKEACLETAKKLISYPSVCDTTKPSSSVFGEPIQECLEFILEYCQAIGCTTYLDPAGYYGYADYGAGAEMIGIIGHLDVVPLGDKSLWKTNPFDGVVKEGKLFGRGACDDKGPTAASLHSLKALIDLGITFKKRVRYIFSTDEESLFRCMAAYRENEEIPTITLVPDGSFPFTYGEKGLGNIKLHGPGSKHFTLTGGEAFNVVPSKATYQGPLDLDLKQELAKKIPDGIFSADQLIATGKSCHSSLNHLGENAINKLAMALKETKISHPLLAYIQEQIGTDPHGTKLLGKQEDDLAGKLSFNLGKIEIEENHSELWIDIRYPFSTTYDQIEQTIRESIVPYGLTMEKHDQWDGILIPLETPFIQTILETYQAITGDTTSPSISRGATLARTLPNAIAFGTRKPLGSNHTAHQENEYIELAEMYDGMAVYTNVLYKLVTSENSLLA